MNRPDDSPHDRPISNRDRQLMWVGLSYPTLLTAVYFLALAEGPALLQQTVYSVGKLVQFGLPLYWASRQPASRWSLFRPSPRGLSIGLVFGVIVGVAMVLLFRATLAQSPLADRMREAILRKLLGFSVATSLRYAVLALFYCLVHSGLEEYYWRWFVHRSCRENISSGWLASLTSSLGFMAHHVLLLTVFLGWSSPWTWFCSAGVATGGVFWAWLYERVGRITAAWLSHMLVDAAIFIIGFTLIERSLR